MDQFNYMFHLSLNYKSAKIQFPPDKLSYLCDSSHLTSISEFYCQIIYIYQVAMADFLIICGSKFMLSSTDNL